MSSSAHRLCWCDNGCVYQIVRDLPREVVFCANAALSVDGALTSQLLQTLDEALDRGTIDRVSLFNRAPQRLAIQIPAGVVE